MIDLFPPVLLSGTPEDPFYIMEYWTTIPQSIATAMVYRFLGNLDPLNIPTQAMQLTGTISTIPILIPAIGVKKLLSAYNQWVSQGTNPAPFLYSLTLGTTPVQVTIPTQVLVIIFTMMHTCRVTYSRLCR